VVLATYASAALICAVSLLVGRAILVVLRRDASVGLEGPVGLAALIAVCSFTIRLPHRATTTLVVLVVIALASVVVLRGRVLPSSVSLAVAVPAALLTLLIASIPFIASGHVSVLGIGINNDLAGHLHYTAWLEDPSGIAPHAVREGYPVGPHGLAAAIAKATGAEPLSTVLGLILAIPVLTAIAALAVLREVKLLLRVIAAALTALPFLAASTLAIGGFKETIMALLVIGLALGLRELDKGTGDRRGVLVALGVLMAGMLGVYSYPGVAYALVIGAVWAVFELVALRRRGGGEQFFATLKKLAPLALIPLALIALVALVDVSRIRDFAKLVGDVFDAPSRFKEAISPFEALPLWPSGSFVEGKAGLDGYLAFGIAGLVALAIGVAHSIRRRETALLATLIALIAVYLITLTGGYYVQAKALAVAAPLIALLAFRGLLGTWGPADRPRPALPVLRAILATAFIAIAAYSSFLALRDARVAPPEYAQAQLGEFRPIVRGKHVLSLTSDRFTDYWLRGASVQSPARFAEENILPRQGKFERLPVDFDSVVPGALDRFDYAVTTTAAYKSAPPSNFKPVEQTKDFVLWKRVGKTPQIGILPEQERPGAIDNCKNPKLRQIVADAEKQGYDTARVQPTVGVGKRLFWAPGSSLTSGESISQQLKMPKGTWQLSLQYYSPILDITVSADGLHTTLPPTADGGVIFRTDQGPFWPVGAVTSNGGPVKITVSAGGYSGLQKALGVDQGADIGNVTATQPENAREVPLSQACGLYIDHYTVGPG
jgi:hypothetical protein